MRTNCEIQPRLPAEVTESTGLIGAGRFALQDGGRGHSLIRGGVRSQTEPDGVGTMQENNIRRIVAYMGQHLDEPLSIARLATMANVSPSYFFALFKRYTSRAPNDYFTRLRMREACRLLAATSLSVKEVAAVLGYEDQFYFSRVFKSVHGVAPRAYRAGARRAGHEDYASPRPVTEPSRTGSMLTLPGLAQCGRPRSNAQPMISRA